MVGEDLNEIDEAFLIILASALLNLIFSQVYNGENELISSGFNMALPVSLWNLLQKSDLTHLSEYLCNFHDVDFECQTPYPYCGVIGLHDRQL